ncbi:hypothetical protein DSBG_3019 [Desulfosporosinus sp. BG]|nr:hypothetical protein DSBG_3019 [Desulfosporosinus sp. BG]
MIPPSISILISLEDVSCVHLNLYIIQTSIITVCNNRIATLLKLIQVIDDYAAEEGGTIFQSWLVDNHSRAFSFDTLHNTLNGALAEVIGIRLHGQTENTDDHRFFLALVIEVILVISIIPSHLKNTICNEIFSRSVALHNGFNKILRHISVIGHKLFRIFRQTVTAISEGRIVVVTADTRIKAHH